LKQASRLDDLGGFDYRVPARGDRDVVLNVVGGLVLGRRPVVERRVEPSMVDQSMYSRSTPTGCAIHRLGPSLSTADWYPSARASGPKENAKAASVVSTPMPI